MCATEGPHDNTHIRRPSGLSSRTARACLGGRSVVFGFSVADKCGTCDTTHLNDCQRDCKGVWGGKAKRDLCGKCGGNNSTCMDCAKNVCRGPICVNPNTQKMVMRSFKDRCGACVSGGAGRACRPDCKGVYGGKATRDNCGVCAGDNTTCADCAGTPFGDAYKDACGKCDANDVNDCMQDCAGIWGGNAVEDKCGVCKGASVPLMRARVAA